MTFKFNWDGFTKADFEKYCEQVKNDLYGGEYYGNVRVGELCFELRTENTCDYYGPVFEGTYLIYDMYIGGIDSGYGYSSIDEGFPYDVGDGGSFAPHGDCTSMTYEQFQRMAEDRFTRHIENCHICSFAARPLHIW